MADLEKLSDRELRNKLIHYGIGDIPVTRTTRDIVIRRLKSVIETEDEPAKRENNETRSHRRRSSSKQMKTRQRTSLLLSHDSTAGEEDEENEVEVSASNRKTKITQKSRDNEQKSLNGDDSIISTSNLENHLSDEELKQQLIRYNIPCSTITFSTRPILIKKLNHAMAKSRRESKLISLPKLSSKHAKPAKEADVDTESDSIDNTSLSIKSNRQSTPNLSFSHQHSLTLGNFTINSTNGFGHNKTPFSDTPNRPSLSSHVVSRFIEEQEYYDTGSDSEVDKDLKKNTTKSSWKLGSWFSSKQAKQDGMKQVRGMQTILKEKLNIICHWQFIAVVLPVLAALFFLVLAAFYISAINGDQPEMRDDTIMKNTIPVENRIHSLLLHLKSYLEQQNIPKSCQIESKVLTSKELVSQLNVENEVLEQLELAVQQNPQLGISVSNSEWTVPPGKLPLWCSVQKQLWNIFFSILFIASGFMLLALCHYLVTSTWRHREKEEQEVYSLVEQIIDLLARHHAVTVTERRPQDAYLAVSHVRDLLIPLKERKQKLKLWNKAVQFLEENESRVRAEIQQIEGEDYRVWRWLPPNTAYSPGKAEDNLRCNEDLNRSPRPKVWQGQAFSTGSSGVNSPPPYPLTQCLKVRNMFDAEMEVGDSWPIRIQDAILEKSEGAKILHLAVDKTSREGCVYIKCQNAEEAGKVYRSLHGWWFDGSLVTVKYLRPERYHYRFPDSVHVTVPLQPSNDKRLSLQTKFWKSPLEHF